MLHTFVQKKKKKALRRPPSAHQSQEKTTRPEYWGTTLTSPTVYIALDGTWSLTSAGTVYHNHSRVLLPQIPTEVSSICGVVGGEFLPQTFNYADLHGPPPASAYSCQPSCVSPQYRPHWVNRTSVGRGFTLGSIMVPDSTKTYLYDDYNGVITENLCSTLWDDFRPALSLIGPSTKWIPVFAFSHKCTYNTQSHL